MSEIRLFPYKIPFIHPFHNASSRLKQRSGFIAALPDRNRNLLADCPAAPELGTESSEHSESIIREFMKINRPVPIAENTRQIAEILHDFNEYPAARFALEQLLTQKMLYQKQETGLRSSVKLSYNAVIGLSNQDSRISQAEKLIKRGFTVLKCKISWKSLESDLDFLRELSRLPGDKLSLRLDANGDIPGDMVDELLSALREIPLNIEYIEDICIDPLDMDRIASRSAIPLAIDSALRTAADLRTLPPLQHIRHFVLKPLLLGGMTPIRDFILSRAGKETHITFSSAFEHPLGLSYCKLAAARLQPQNTHGLAVSQLYDKAFYAPVSPIEEYGEKQYLKQVNAISKKVLR